ncbi:MAG: RagB/SusD family nutrient uptake outer membrane protein [Prevotella sp.]|nr:RagB/SusD family nutrient uptake outer membrane protein [Prevotella sp.]
MNSKSIRTKIQTWLLQACSILAPLTLGGVGGGCSDYLEIYPENVQPTDEYWGSKQDVEATLFAGYYYLRDAVETHLIPWGELRAGCVSARGSNTLQRFEIKPTEKTLSKWTPMYKIINSANLVLKNAGKALDADDTYSQEEMNSHHCEAYWLRALAYFYIVRNWRDAPLITEPFETDELTFNVPKSPEAQIVAQIKADLKKAIDMDAAKEKFNTTWETKGRATKWAIYALMADVCLWNKDFDEAITYANAILESTSPSSPRFITMPTHSAWFAMFNPGNSNESIYEVQWSYSKLSNGQPQTNTLTTSFDPNQTGYRYQYSLGMLEQFRIEQQNLLERFNYMITDNELYGRMMYGAYVTDQAAIENANNAYVWKYYGGTSYNTRRMSVQDYDCNYIIYRVADVMLMKAEALVMRQAGASVADNQAAVDIINQIRHRTNLGDSEVDSHSSLADLMQKGVLHERLLELSGEGKAWYDMLRMGRYTDPAGVCDFRQLFVNSVVQFNKGTNESWLRSVLSDPNAWFLPVNATEISTNPLLEQNPYYL